jgi:hypothetical protein
MLSLPERVTPGDIASAWPNWAKSTHRKNVRVDTMR